MTRHDGSSLLQVLSDRFELNNSLCNWWDVPCAHHHRSRVRLAVQGWSGRSGEMDTVPGAGTGWWPRACRRSP